MEAKEFYNPDFDLLSSKSSYQKVKTGISNIWGILHFYYGCTIVLNKGGRVLTMKYDVMTGGDFICGECISDGKIDYAEIYLNDGWKVRPYLFRSEVKQIAYTPAEIIKASKEYTDIFGLIDKKLALDASNYCSFEKSKENVKKWFPDLNN